MAAPSRTVVRASPDGGDPQSRPPGPRPLGDSPPESSKSTGKRSLAASGGQESRGAGAGEASSVRMTRSRARGLGLELPGAGDRPLFSAVEAEQGDASEKDPRPLRKKIKVEVAAAERAGSRQFKTAAEAAAALDFSAFPVSSRPLLPRYPPCPARPAQVPARPRTLDDVRARCARLKAGQKRAQECLKIKKLRAPRTNLLTMTAPKDPDTAAAVVTSRDKSIVLSTAPYVVSISSTKAIDGESILNCSGIIIGWDETSKCTRVVTSSRSVLDIEGKLFDPKPKLSVRLSNGSLVDGHLLFFNFHYGIAVLEVMSDLPLLQVPFGSSPTPFVSSPTYGQEVFLLARDETSSLIARSGMILWVDDPYCWCNHYMHHDCDMPKVGVGGPVINRDGKIIGITLRGSAFTAISTVQTCIRMWTQFRRIARPVLSMSLKSVELLDVSTREKLSVRHGINKGFVARHVRINSIAERVGIRIGDVLVPCDEQCASITTLPKLEDHLLSLGWGYLQGLYETANVKFALHDPLGQTWSDIILPVWYSEALEYVDGLHG